MRTKGILPVVCVLSVLALPVRSLAAWTWTSIDAPYTQGTWLRGISGNRMVGAIDYGSVWFDGATWKSVLGKPGWYYPNATGISGDRFVGRYYEDNAISKSHGFLYDGSTYTTFDYPGATQSAAHGISGNKIVGVYDGGGYLYDGATWHSLEYPGATFTAPRGIDGSNIVGSWGNAATRNHGFYYNGVTWVDLSYPGAPETYAYGISGSNIVGNYYATGEHGFLYDYNSGSWMTLAYPGATSTTAYGIDGNNIVGSYRDSSGQYHGFLLTIPEPGTLFLLGLGCLLTKRRG